MKKIILASAISMAMFSGATMAAQNGQVTFLGAVTQTTCDLKPSVNGSDKNQVDLGTVNIGATATQPTPFSLVKDGSSACAGLTQGKTATIAWMGNLNDKGVVNESTGANAATGAWVKLTPVNANTNNDIKQGQDSVVFDATKLGTEGFKFNATLTGDNTPGEFRSVVSYAVAYN